MLATLSEYHETVASVGSIFRDRMRRLDGTQPDDTVLSEIAARVEGRLIGPKIILCGAPASGKGKQCERIMSQYGVRHVNAGDIVRQTAADESSEFSQQVQALLANGEPLPDELQAEIIARDLNEPAGASVGWILDGYPRNAHQAMALKNAGVSPHCVLHLEVSEAALIERQLHRRLDPVTGQIYHLNTDPPPSKQVANRLVQRIDDTEQKIRERLQTAQAAQAAVLATWPHVVHTVDGDRADDLITTDIFEILKLQR